MEPFINLEENIGKVVGRRTKTPDGLKIERSTKRDAIAWRRSLGGVRVPRGVFRFATHEEADEWMWKAITRPRQS